MLKSKVYDIKVKSVYNIVVRGQHKSITNNKVGIKYQEIFTIMNVNNYITIQLRQKNHN